MSTSGIETRSAGATAFLFHCMPLFRTYAGHVTAFCCLSVWFHCLSLPKAGQGVTCALTTAGHRQDGPGGAFMAVTGVQISRRREFCHSAAPPPSTFTRCFNRDKKGGHQNDSLADG